jgi:hypothetical protein
MSQNVVVKKCCEECGISLEIPDIRDRIMEGLDYTIRSCRELIQQQDEPDSFGFNVCGLVHTLELYQGAMEFDLLDGEDQEGLKLVSTDTPTPLDEPGPEQEPEPEKR